MTIRVERRQDGVATLLMDRPEKRNAFTLAMYRDFGALMRELDADDTVRCIVVRGTGGAFCAGSDIGGFEGDRDGRTQARDYAEFTLEMTDQLKNTRHPTVACIEGVCVGGGLEIAAMCDIRIAGRSSRYGIPINRIGLTLDYRELDDLIAVVGHTHALEILLEGHIFGVEEALAKGIVTRFVEDDQVVSAAYATAERIQSSGAPREPLAQGFRPETSRRGAHHSGGAGRGLCLLRYGRLPSWTGRLQPEAETGICRTLEPVSGADEETLLP